MGKNDNEDARSATAIDASRRSENAAPMSHLAAEFGTKYWSITEYNGNSRIMEARAGIEPACKDLQSSA